MKKITRLAVLCAMPTGVGPIEIKAIMEMKWTNLQINQTTSAATTHTDISTGSQKWVMRTYRCMSRSLYLGMCSVTNSNIRRRLYLRSIAARGVFVWWSTTHGPRVCRRLWQSHRATWAEEVTEDEATEEYSTHDNKHEEWHDGHAVVEGQHLVLVLQHPAGQPAQDRQAEDTQCRCTHNKVIVTLNK